MLQLPTRRDESWRYSDLSALQSVWPLHAPTSIVVSEGQSAHHCLLQDAADGTAAVHDYVITVADGARCDFHLLNIGGKLGRVTFTVTLGSHATGSYLGSINVARDAQRTDAFQSIKAMLLDRTATANAKPELEIYADDVKCAHGATVGELDKAALFYMASRGMDPATAKTLLLRSFVAGVFDDMPDEAVKDRFEAAAIAKLEALV